MVSRGSDESLPAAGSNPKRASKGRGGAESRHDATPVGSPRSESLEEGGSPNLRVGGETGDSLGVGGGSSTPGGRAAVEVPQRLKEVGTGPRGTVYEMCGGPGSGGSGGIAVKVFHRGLGVDRAVLGRFLETSPKRLRHPNLPRLHAVDENADGSIFYTAPLLAGDSLADIIGDLKRGESVRPSLSPLSVGPQGETHPRLHRETTRLLAEVAEGLALAHSEGVVHRRIHPRNLLFSPSGRLVLTDFGGGSSASADEGSSAAATPASRAELMYCAPECLDGSTEPGPAADVYSLGVILFELLTWRAPFEAETLDGLVKAIARGRRLPLPQHSGRDSQEDGPEIHEALRACVEKALARQPEDRFAHAGALAQDLRLFLGDEPPTAWLEVRAAKEAREQQEREKRERSQRLNWARRAALLVAAGLLAVVAYQSGRRSAIVSPAAQIPNEQNSSAQHLTPTAQHPKFGAPVSTPRHIQAAAVLPPQPEPSQAVSGQEGTGQEEGTGQAALVARQDVVVREVGIRPVHLDAFRQKLTDGLARLPQETATTLCLQLLEHDSPEVREAAGNLLAADCDPYVVHALTTKLVHGNPTLRARIGDVLLTLGERGCLKDTWGGALGRWQGTAQADLVSTVTALGHTMARNSRTLQAAWLGTPETDRTLRAEATGSVTGESNRVLVSKRQTRVVYPRGYVASEGVWPPEWERTFIELQLLQSWRHRLFPLRWERTRVDTLTSSPHEGWVRLYWHRHGDTWLQALRFVAGTFH